MFDFNEQLARIIPTELQGRVLRIAGQTAAVGGFPAPIGAMAEIERGSGPPLEAEVTGFQESATLLSPLGDLSGIRRGDRVRLKQTMPWLRVGDALLGRVINSMGRAIDGRPQPVLSQRTLLDRRPPNPIDRPRITEPLTTGIRAIDGMLTCGRGQRMGIFAGPGVGKSVLLGMMCRYSSADVRVICLVGERGREVNDFLEQDLGREGLAKSVVVVATSDEPAIVRVRAAFTATAIAEYFRDAGRDVLLLTDSLTRFAQAQREIGLAAGEPPTTRGFPPSVFAMLPKLVERTGRGPHGSITAFYSVLAEGNDPDEPISDAVRGLLDGHTLLSRKLAGRGHFPAIDMLDSISRLATVITSKEQQQAATTVRELLSAYQDNEDLISIGAYRRGSNPAVDAAIEMRDEIETYLRQGITEPSTMELARTGLANLLQGALRRRQMAASKAAAAHQQQQFNPQ